jgi:tRNA dimethylallyltransferase
MPSDPRPPVIILVGPTAVGKTKLSLQLAERFNGEIVSADSRLLYRGMDIGTAKPSLEERARVPHHLVDVANPDEIWSLALFQQEARRAIASIHARGRLPFLVGGTGQYIRAVTQEWDIPKAQPDPPMRAALDKWAADVGADGLHFRLAVIDPEAAANIDYRNVRRTIRALEVIFQTGRKFSSQKQRGRSPYRTLQIGLTRSRPELYQHVDERIKQMIAQGLATEVQALLEQGYSPSLPTMTAIGYREMIAYLAGEITLEEAVVLMKRMTRVFVRRQANWFKTNDPDIHWFSVDPLLYEKVSDLMRNWI